MRTAYQKWHEHFSANAVPVESFPWEDSYRLTRRERECVAKSLQQFQLGEYARGRGFRRRAAATPVLSEDPQFLPSLDLFIQEEQMHSEMLGRFLDLQGIPRLRTNWVDGVFRRLRKLAGLELCVMVLVTAEVLAVPFYQALRDATHSPLLKAICRRILCDEAAHLMYQGQTLGLLRRSAWMEIMQRLLFNTTAVLVWRQHRRVFHGAGWGFFRYWNDAHREFERLQARIHRVSNGSVAEGVVVRLAD